MRARTVRELKRLDAGRWFGWRFRGQRIQTLPEVLERFRGRAGFVVALRAGSDVYPGIEERRSACFTSTGRRTGRSWPPTTTTRFARCRALDWEIRLGARVAGRLLAPAALAPPGTLTALCLDAGMVLEPDVAACRDAGLECYLTGVPGAADARPLARLAAHRPGHGVRLRLLSISPRPLSDAEIRISRSRTV